jgi:hypothetical protein
MPLNKSAPLPARLYAVQHNDCCNFVAGVSAKGEQVLMGVAPGHAVAAFFDRSGHFLREEVREAPVEPAGSASLAEEDEQQAYAEWQALRAWGVELGLVAGEIRIAGFSLPDWDDWGKGIGVFDLPRFMEGCAENPLSEPDEQFRQELQTDIEWFRGNEKYVLRWGTEYWMSKDGEITDT